MKKASLVMIALTIMFCVFAAGFLLGKNTGHSPITISAVPAATHTTNEPVSISTAPSAPAGPININTATVADLTTLPGIGEVLAQRIVAYRNANGPFESIAQLSNVEGIGDKKLENILQYITIGGQP